MVEMPLCEVCEARRSVGVASVPGVPYSAAYCAECLRANAHPWGILIAQVALLGGLDQCIPDVRHMAEDTAKHLGKTMDDFNGAVAETMKELDNDERIGNGLDQRSGQGDS